MSVTRRTKRPRHSRRRLDLSAVREALADQRVQVALGVVTDIDADGSHFQLDGEDLLVELLLMPAETRITARMGICGGGPAAGLWLVPPVGAEVAVLVPEGDLAFGPIIVGVLSSGAMPEGVGPTAIVLASPSGGKVVIHDGTGVAKALAYKEDVDALKEAHDNHTHILTLSAASGSGGTGTAAPPATPAPAPVGTSVLEAK